MNDNLRKELVDYFLTDSRDYLTRYDILLDNFTHIGNRSKLLVDLLFSMECSLKALIFLRSTDNEKQTYKKIKVHSLAKLFNQLDTIAITDIVNFVTSNKLDDISVGTRYLLEANILFRENGILGKKYYNTIACPKWIDEVYQTAKKLLEFVDKERDVKFGKITIQDLSEIGMNLLLENTDRIKNINN